MLLDIDKTWHNVAFEFVKIMYKILLVFFLGHNMSVLLTTG